MRMSKLFGRTLREAPADAEIESHKLLVRAGCVRQVGAGLYSYLPLGWRVLQKVAAIVREEMDRVGGQEVLLPVLNPADLWRESGRWSTIGPELVRFADRAGRDFVLAMTAEEVVADLARREIRSFRQLPVTIYQIQTKVRDEARPRGGLIRTREFLMKDAYSLHADDADLDACYPEFYHAYERIFRRCGVDALPVEADTGAMGGSGSHEFVALTPIGEDTIIRCSGCDYAANVERAVARKDSDLTLLPPFPAGEGGYEAVHTPGARTIADLMAFFGLPASAFLKSVFYFAPDDAGGRVVVAAIRGDLDVNEAKLRAALGVSELRLATEAEVRAVGIVPGFGSPVGLKMGAVRVVVDDSVPGRDFVAGANRESYHLRGVRLGRDFAGTVADIAVAGAGGRCVRCGAELRAERGIELGHTFKLGTRYSAAMGATYLDASGQHRPLVMGCYGIGLGRLLAAVVERHHDEHGIAWPESLAPYRVYLCPIGLDKPGVRDAAEALYADLLAAGVEVLYDDRDEAPGVKFADADLIGVPLRAIVSARSLGSASAEVKRRGERQGTLVPLGEVAGPLRLRP